MNDRFWRSRRVLVTGHTGFKGAWLSHWLVRLGAEVHGFALAPQGTSSLFDGARLSGELTSNIGDLADRPALERAFATAQPDIVLHLAAQPLVRRSYVEPAETFATNVNGTVHVLECIRRSSTVKAAVMITTDKVYENQEWPWGYREVDALGGHDPYAASKACAELAVAAYRRSFFGRGPHVASARAGNVIGGGDWAEDRLIPDAIRALASGQAVPIRNPSAVRPWQHVLDPLHAYLTLAQALFEEGERHATAYNFGPNPEDVWPVSRVIDRVCALWADGARWEKVGGEQPHETHTLLLDSSKARRVLRWQPRTTLRDGLDWTIRFYQDVLRGADVRARMNEDISRFEELSLP